MNLSQYLQKANGNLGPGLIVNWAKAHAGTLAQGDANTGRLVKMYNNFFKTTANVDRGVYAELNGNEIYTFVQLFVKKISSIDIDDVYPPVGHWEFGRLVKTIKMMSGFAYNMQQWAYPACRYYYTADATEVSTGCSKDFTTKHVSTTQDAKNSRRVAQIRMTPREERNVDAFGGIVTSLSGAIHKEAFGDFIGEIKGRQEEFSKAHNGLCNYYADNYLQMQAGSASQFAFFDHLTFVTQNKYPMFEFRDGRLIADDDFHISFAVSATANGDAWVVHHLSGTSENRGEIPRNKTPLTRIIEDADTASYVKVPS